MTFRRPESELPVGVATITATPRVPGEIPVAEPTLAVLGSFAPAPSPSEAGSELRVLLQALRAELQHLTRQIDQTWADRADSADVERAAFRVVDVAEHLPDRIVGALAAALKSQHQAIMADVQRVLDERKPDTTATDLLDQLPGRLAAQLDNLSTRLDQRLNNLGDRLEELIAAETPMQLVDTAGIERNAAILAEVDQLRRVVAGTLDLLEPRQPA